MNGFDASCLVQFAADWLVHGDWAIGGNAIGYIGGGDTEFGQASNPFTLGLYVGRSL
jgi:hypothetical protein